MSQPLISIITPCYNAAPFLKEAMDSVLSQTYPHFEWVLVNDGSTDATEAIIHSSNDARIRYYKQENKGQCAASNFGLSKATGDYIKFFDADDVMNAQHLEAQLKKLNGRTDALASCAWGRFYDGNPASAQFIPETVWEDLESLTWIRKALSQQYDMMGAWVWLIPKGVLEKTGGWDASLSLNNDFEFSIRLLLAVKEVLFTEDAKMYYRSGNASLSQRPSEKAFAAAIRSTDMGCAYLLQRDHSPLMKQLCANRYQEWLYRIYPDAPLLQQEVEQKIKLLGGSNRSMDGGKVFQLLSSIFGWKKAKQLQRWLKQRGYRKLPFN
ncbi:glycosyltransferase [Lacibacter sp. MH-610]|uniref:glycosyltransferase family 2 protein n=1 Tax=Lacibacter sp. MH-610 TaxID=3020883 RepID=UPI003892C5F3